MILRKKFILTSAIEMIEGRFNAKIDSNKVEIPISDRKGALRPILLFTEKINMLYRTKIKRPVCNNFGIILLRVNSENENNWIIKKSAIKKTIVILLFFYSHVPDGHWIGVNSLGQG